MARRTPAPIPAGAPGEATSSLEPIPGTEGRGFTAEGPPTPPVPTEPTMAELQQGVTAQNRMIGNDPVAQAMAKAQIERQIKSGVRGPKGGARFSSTQMPRSPANAPRTTDEMARLAKVLHELPTAQLKFQSESPLVEEWVKQVARKELARR